jgi:hypothetical protein
LSLKICIAFVGMSLLMSGVVSTGALLYGRTVVSISLRDFEAELLRH